MFRFPLVRVQRILRKPNVCALRFTSSQQSAESDEEFDNRYEAYFAKDGMDAWAIRKGINDIVGQDLIPEPKIIVAALKACRRVNDFAVAIRFLEAIKNKCGSRVDEIYPYIIQEIRPTLTELGINTPEELGFDKPELAVQNVYEMH
ncbi:PREDICTED: cytochrome c oxidase subunit 5A, mitochondrial-like [Nicrophorus vespilloides]|uniref:Cytochrome c oxidase subunit 5A, mitochondrial n=1 Tax=Nicrophorus vespilloides TaxID=110193 RepID=A0ABM1MSX8_NICVS|nr:PREDICTED: cytochrome c oxidase subunit 5A, mitochondrial-like [Nicrophorus vespilloides]